MTISSEIKAFFLLSRKVTKLTLLVIFQQFRTTNQFRLCSQSSAWHLHAKTFQFLCQALLVSENRKCLKLPSLGPFFMFLKSSCTNIKSIQSMYATILVHGACKPKYFHLAMDLLRNSHISHENCYKPFAAHFAMCWRAFICALFQFLFTKLKIFKDLVYHQKIQFHKLTSTWDANML